MRHLVMFSGGAGSWLAAKRVREKHPGEVITLLFTDTRMEDPDLYRFLLEAAEDVGGELVQIAEGRTPWEVFRDERFLGNHRVDPCSKFLKRKLARRWAKANFDASDTVVYFGIGWDEAHRWGPIEKHWRPYEVKAPLMDPPHLLKEQVLESLDAAGLKRPHLYDLGFPHNNCGGFCIKAGQAHFKLLLKTMPERYAYHERHEEALRAFLGKDVAIMTDQSGKGPRRPLTMRAFRARVTAKDPSVDDFDWGGCGCMADYEPQPD